jgi:hypothetical protein
MNYDLDIKYQGFISFLFLVKESLEKEGQKKKHLVLHMDAQLPVG